jgi:hypothetical protein
VWHAAIPPILFAGLDTYYLALERAFRQAYNECVSLVQQGSAFTGHLYAVHPKSGAAARFRRSLGSVSVWPFYLTIAILIAIARALV